MNRATIRRCRAVAALALVAAMTTGLSACALDVAHDAETGAPATSAEAADSGDQRQASDSAAADGPRSTPTTELRKGDCIGHLIGQLAITGRADEVDLVDCATPHDAQVGGNFTVAGDSWPGKDALQVSARVECPIVLSDALVSDTPALDFFFLWPEEHEWDAGSHLVSCLVRAADGEPLSESVLS